MGVGLQEERARKGEVGQVAQGIREGKRREGKGGRRKGKCEEHADGTPPWLTLASICISTFNSRFYFFTFFLLLFFNVVSFITSLSPHTLIPTSHTLTSTCLHHTPQSPLNHPRHIQIKSSLPNLNHTFIKKKQRTTKAGNIMHSKPMQCFPSNCISLLPRLVLLLSR